MIKINYDGEDLWGGNVTNGCSCKFVNDEPVEICAYHDKMEKENKRLYEVIERLNAEIAHKNNYIRNIKS